MPRLPSWMINAQKTTQDLCDTVQHALWGNIDSKHTIKHGFQGVRWLEPTTKNMILAHTARPNTADAISSKAFSQTMASQANHKKKMDVRSMTRLMCRSSPVVPCRQSEPLKSNNVMHMRQQLLIGHWSCIQRCKRTYRSHLLNRKCNNQQSIYATCCKEGLGQQWQRLPKFSAGDNLAQ